MKNIKQRGLLSTTHASTNNFNFYWYYSFVLIDSVHPKCNVNNKNTGDVVNNLLPKSKIHNFNRKIMTRYLEHQNILRFSFMLEYLLNKKTFKISQNKNDKK